MPILNYTTTVSIEKTVAEIQKILASKGALRIMTEYSSDKILSGLSFQMMIKSREISFKLPANIGGVYKSLQLANIPQRFKTEEQAAKVCWRILKNWLEANLALIEAGQADMATVMLPYAIMKDGGTVAENLLDGKRNNLLLTNE